MVKLFQCRIRVEPGYGTIFSILHPDSTLAGESENISMSNVLGSDNFSMSNTLRNVLSLEEGEIFSMSNRGPEPYSDLDPDSTLVGEGKNNSMSNALQSY